MKARNVSNVLRKGEETLRYWNAGGKVQVLI